MPTVEVVHLAYIEQREMRCRAGGCAAATVHASTKRRFLTADGRQGVEWFIAYCNGTCGCYFESEWFHFFGFRVCLPDFSADTVVERITLYRVLRYCSTSTAAERASLTVSERVNGRLQLPARNRPCLSVRLSARCGVRLCAKP